MDVALVVTTLQGGGAERVVVNLARYWAARKLQVAIVTLADTGQDAYEIPNDVTRIALDLAQPSSSTLHALTSNVARVRALRRTFKLLACRTVIAFLTESNVLSVLASTGLPHRLLIAERVHPPHHPLPSQWRYLRKLTYRWSDGVIAQTQHTADWLVEHTGSRSVAIIPNAVNWPLTIQPPVVEPDELLAETDHVVLAVGRLARQKGFDLLLRAFALTASRHVQWKLVIAGEEETAGEADALDKLVEELQLRDRVIFPGRVGNLNTWYRRCDIFVLSSRYEGFPNVLLESMAAGCTALSFDCDTGPRDIIDHGVNGLLVDANDVQALGQNLSDLMGDENLRRELAHEALAVRSRFDEASVMQLWQEQALLSPSTLANNQPLQ